MVLACHADQALAILADPTLAEHEVLGAMAYQANDTVLHTDASVMPRRRAAWASGNYHLGDAAGRTTVTYHMNRLQALSISSAQAGQRVFEASLGLRHRELSRREMSRALVVHPPAAAATLARIYWNALKLRLKGAPYHRRPAASS